MRKMVWRTPSRNSRCVKRAQKAPEGAGRQQAGRPFYRFTPLPVRFPSAFCAFSFCALSAFCLYPFRFRSAPCPLPVCILSASCLYPVRFPSVSFLLPVCILPASGLHPAHFASLSPTRFIRCRFCDQDCSTTYMDCTTLAPVDCALAFTFVLQNRGEKEQPR